MGNDPIGVALSSIGAGATGGAAVITVGLIAARTLQGATRHVEEGQVQAGFEVLWASVILGLIASVATAWILSRPIGDTWRRGVISALAAFGTSMLAFLAAPADLAAGRTGLSFFLLAALGAFAYAIGRARRAGDEI